MIQNLLSTVGTSLIRCSALLNRYVDKLSLLSGSENNTAYVITGTVNRIRVCSNIPLKVFFRVISQNNSGTVTGKKPGIPLLSVARKTKAPASPQVSSWNFWESIALYMSHTEVRVKIPMVFSCMLLEYDQKQTGMVIHKITGNQPRPDKFVSCF